MVSPFLYHYRMTTAVTFRLNIGCRKTLGYRICLPFLEVVEIIHHIVGVIEANVLQLWRKAGAGV